MRIPAAVFVLFLCASIGAAVAESIPRHLASMAKDILAGGALKETADDSQQEAIRRRARRILKDAGARYWAQGEVRQEGAAAAIAEALEMDISKPDQWVGLRSILAESDRDKQIEMIRQRAKDAGKPAEGPEFEKVISKFDEVRASGAKDLIRHHTMEVGDNNDRLELDWDPVNNGFKIRIRANETSQGAGDGFDLQMNGDVTSAPAIESDDTTLTVRPSDSAMNVLTSEDLRRLQGAIFGKWRGGNGDIWEITSPGGGMQPQNPAETSADRIAELEQKIERVWSDKVFRWQDTNTGEIVVQDRFKKLKGPFRFLGQGSRRADAKEEVARLQKRIEELHAARKRLPVDSYDPVRMGTRTDGEVQSMSIRVTDMDGYSWTYDEALLSNGRITAKRTLRNKQDLAGIKYKDVVRQLIASWSPPEWIELEVRVEATSKQVYITGLRWRLHWTADADDHRVKRIHTPYSRNLRLERAAVKVAQGAAKDQKP